jgi:uncharacterized protein YbjT (DUF2867 family)
MKVILFGATGMIGDGVLRECLADPRVSMVLAVGRTPCGITHAKLREHVRADFFDYRDVRAEWSGYAACFFCLGVSSVGMREADYTRLTYDLTLAAARALAEGNPALVFCYVSGAGTDSTERGRSMWARVKGKTENHLIALPFRAYLFRPAYVQPRRGTRSKTRLYQAFYTVLGPLYPLLRRLAPGYVTTTTALGRAMIEVAAKGHGRRVLESNDINALGERPAHRAAGSESAR